MSRDLRFEHVRTAPCTFPGPPMLNLASPVVAPGGYSTLSPTVKNFKPKSTSGSDSGAQLTSLSPFNRVSKLQKRDASTSRRGTGNPQHKRHIELHACHPRRILSFLIACWPFLPSLSLLTHGKRARHQSRWSKSLEWGLAGRNRRERGAVPSILYCILLPHKQRPIVYSVLCNYPHRSLRSIHSC